MVKLTGDLDVVANADAGARMVLKHPTTKLPLKDESGEASITMRGRDSRIYRDKSREESQIAIQEARSQQADDQLQVDIAKVDKQAVRVLAACTIGWENIADADGQAIAFNEANAVRLYTDFPWIREQVDRFMAVRANFSKG